jgi:UrcA family protein
MSTETAAAAVSRPKITLMMVLCGIVSAASMGTVSAATPKDDVPSIKVQYDPQSLATDSGARAVYRLLVHAAEKVCPDPLGGRPFVSSATAECRRQAIVRAVQEINNPRLAGMYAMSSKRG